MSKFAIDSGHGCYPDIGAEGYLNEQNCALYIANRVINKLQTLGHQAWNVRPSSAWSVSNSLQQRCYNAANSDYLVSIHLNAGGGKGTEVFAMSEAGNALASNVVKALVALGFANRGVKDGSSLYVIRHSKPATILIEVCFVDTQSDADLYNKLGAESIANAIVQGLTGQTANVSNLKSAEQVHYVVCYNNDVDKRSALYLSEYLGCEAIDNSKTPFNYEGYYPIKIGEGNFMSYAKLNLKGEDRYKTMLKVAQYIEGRR
ncbi:N-acetylmuramoyl-L-alanine amidase [Clostridium aciditolerans]|uniref:N-acetylmuramoyl-L-alanine amidase n=1 Tax=Clostridium aciditolerans TaxID=339861 RepID=A0A934HWW4_9CLOT|nr:N-acetylmuramoyl-L-alanine amidase [Clostridium aciditolerans]MBI6872072.1 N-acetylmuramoyl-L-alanine amidase [Clostridium aciditolerans]